MKRVKDREKGLRVVDHIKKKKSGIESIDTHKNDTQNSNDFELKMK